MALDAGGKDVSQQLRQILQAVSTMDRMLSMMSESLQTADGGFTKEMLQEELLAMTAQKAAEKHQNMHIDLSALDGYVLETDYAALSRLLMNLLGNAVKYTQEGGEITLRAQMTHERWRKDAAHIRFVVADNGPGMSRAFMKRMFMPFARAQETVNQPGRGLGLAIAKDMARRLGGTIHVRSERGRGTVFAVSVPVRIRKDGEVG